MGQHFDITTCCRLLSEDGVIFRKGNLLIHRLTLLRNPKITSAYPRFQWSDSDSHLPMQDAIEFSSILYHDDPTLMSDELSDSLPRRKLATLLTHRYNASLELFPILFRLSEPLVLERELSLPEDASIDNLRTAKVTLWIQCPMAAYGSRLVDPITLAECLPGYELARIWTQSTNPALSNCLDDTKQPLE